MCGEGGGTGPGQGRWRAQMRGARQPCVGAGLIRRLVAAVRHESFSLLQTHRLSERRLMRWLPAGVNSLLELSLPALFSLPRPAPFPLTSRLLTSMQAILRKTQETRLLQPLAPSLPQALLKLEEENKSAMNVDPMYSSFHYSHPPLAGAVKGRDKPYLRLGFSFKIKPSGYGPPPP